MINYIYHINYGMSLSTMIFINAISNENELGRDVLVNTLHSVILAVNLLKWGREGLSSSAELKVVDERYYVSETRDETSFPSATSSVSFPPFLFVP